MSVSLEDKEAKVTYNDSDVTAEQISEFIEEMGFNAFVKQVDGRILRTSANALKSSIAKIEELPLQMNGGGDVNAQNRPVKCFLHITVIIRYG